MRTNIYIYIYTRCSAMKKASSYENSFRTIESLSPNISIAKWLPGKIYENLWKFDEPA